MRLLDCESIIHQAWKEYGSKKTIKTVADVSAKVSTNHVFKVIFTDSTFILSKLAFFGNYEVFCEDHIIINVLANKLEPPFQNFLAQSLIKDDEVFIFRHVEGIIDVWVVFYNPMEIRRKLPRRLEEKHIISLGRELALFHKACFKVKDHLLPSSKTIKNDVEELLDILDSSRGKCEHGKNEYIIREHCNIFLNRLEELDYFKLDRIPVFIDWNIGNFSVTDDLKFFSRWDYDWFRISSRVLDFYFFSRVTSSIGDRTTFSYLPDTLMEERFLLFLKEYHSFYPLTENEILLMKEAFRFFILNYVVKHGNYFFAEYFARRLQSEAYSIYLPTIDKKINLDKIFKALNF